MTPDDVPGFVGPDTRVLDAGCGAGGASVIAHGLGGGGHRGRCVRSASGRGATQGADWRVSRCRPGVVAVKPNSFDSIIAVSSIQYAESPVAAARELERVVTPDGRIGRGVVQPRTRSSTGSYSRRYAHPCPRHARAAGRSLSPRRASLRTSSSRLGSSTLPRSTVRLRSRTWIRSGPA